MAPCALLALAGLLPLGLAFVGPARPRASRCASRAMTRLAVASIGDGTATAADDDLSGLSRPELEALVRRYRNENAMLRRPLTELDPQFEFGEAVLAAGFAFESYNAPSGARWERGADGCDVAFSSAEFVRACYGGALLVKVVKAKGLRSEQILSEAALTGAAPDPYVLLAMVENTQAGSKKARASNATDVARTPTMWRLGGSKEKDNSVTWEDETYCLYARNAEFAKLSITVMDEDVGDDVIMGQGEIELSDVLASFNASGRSASLGAGASSATWKGDVVLSLDKPKVFDVGAGVAAAAVAGIAGLATGGIATLALAAAAVSAASQAKNLGKVTLELEYVPFLDDADVAALTTSPQLQAKLALKAPVGASPDAGVDWSQLCTSYEECARYGDVAEAAAALEALCFVDHRDTGTQAGLWRDVKRKRLLVSFRGTSEARDVITDASAIMTPWERDATLPLDGYDDSVSLALGDPNVHAGFRGAADSIAQRLKQLVLVAVDDDPTDWEIIVTGHSLGGALATIFSYDISAAVDSSRALPVRKPRSKPWFMFSSSPDVKKPQRPKFRRLRLITFGGPRVGDAAFAAGLDAAVPHAFRVVNGQDIVARLPRGFSYAHGARTVLVSDTPEEAALWVERQDSGDCPLKQADSALAGGAFAPSSKGNLIAEMIDDALKEDPISLFDPFGAAGRLKAIADSAGKKLGKAKAADFAGLMGVNTDYANTELKLLAALQSGDAIKHHLEPAYFTAMIRAAKAFKQRPNAPVTKPAAPVTTPAEEIVS
ncbi:hypothetical protein M885DRAFT_507178 [Pelagophyceae sp. CCMP2097]|nr:hypothetical protein M885DRAFT_507178 [Pelagophyceae sp. CCMP2097]